MFVFFHIPGDEVEIYCSSVEAPQVLSINAKDNKTAFQQLSVLRESYLKQIEDLEEEYKEALQAIKADYQKRIEAILSYLQTSS